MSKTSRVSLQWVGVALALTAILSATSVLAGDNIYRLSIADALNTVDAKSRLDGNVRFYFGDSQHPAVLKNLGTWDTNDKTNGFAKSDEKSCNWVFLSALVKFQAKAERVGANAVVNIHSYYRREDISSDTQIECHVGFLLSGIALKGDFVKLAN